MAILKNIVFDLGGVLLNIDYNKTADAFARLGIKHFNEMFDQFSADELFEKLETGHITEQHFYEAMMARDKALTVDSIIQSWNAMLIDFRLESLQFLEELAKEFNLYLLSNTNIIHKTNFDKRFRRETGKNSIDDYFKKAYYSHQIGLRKPNDDIFHFILKDAGIKAGETLFVDDSYNNIETAAKLGIRTHLLRPDERIENLQIFI